MSKTIFVSNRLPVTAMKNDSGITFVKSIGGLATGLKSFHSQSSSLWAGWPGIASDELNPKEKQLVRRQLLRVHQCMPVFLTECEIERYYHGFCNNTVWPLFHYFTGRAEYDPQTWDAYRRVNEKFFETVSPVIENGDMIWIHDYQLMLLPRMIKEKFPGSKVGFFLHIPFPSFEVFRLLVWRDEILRGMLGADLIGFHTYDYVRHFLSSARRLLGLDYHLNRLNFEGRYVQADAFPMGIDYARFSAEPDSEEYREQLRKLEENRKGRRLILSIDRLDYTKGIPGRIKAYGRFLEENPDYREKVYLVMIVAPSRVEVDSYGKLNREIERQVSEINGRFGAVSWTPILYFFQSFSQESLIAFYRQSDVLLVTPLRDGMNLVSKEYIASRQDLKGMIVISETAGAASELGEAVVVNASDTEAIANGIKAALEMPEDEKMSVNQAIHARLERYNVEFWARDFLRALKSTDPDKALPVAQDIERQADMLMSAYKRAKKRLLLLDYDGTLVGFKALPSQAKPDEELKLLLFKLAQDPKNTVAIVSGRDRHTLSYWLGDLNLHFLASHGLWLKRPGSEWQMTLPLDNSWKSNLRHVLQIYTDRMPGSLIEEKEYSLAFHYRQCEPDMVAIKLSEIKDALLSMIETMNLGIQEGDKVLEIKDNRVSKGYGASHLLRGGDYDFILGAGDDHTDEDLFYSLPDDAFSIKIGIGSTYAKYHLKSWQSMRSLLQRFAEAGKTLT